MVLRDVLRAMSCDSGQKEARPEPRFWVVPVMRVART
jgi:hypothetical protein